MIKNNALKNHILDVASDLFYKKGIKSTGVDAIVKSSEIAKMSFYKYFPSKNDLIKEYLKKDCDVLELRLRAELQKKNKCIERVFTIFNYFVELSSVKDYRGIAFINVFIETSMDLKFVKDQSIEFNDTLIKLFYEQMDSDFSENDSKKMADQFTQLLIGSIIQAQMKNNCDPVLLAMSTAKELIEKNYVQSPSNIQAETSNQ